MTINAAARTTYLATAPNDATGRLVSTTCLRMSATVTVAEKHYLGVATNIPSSAKTLEDAMEITELTLEFPNSI
jgi:hypothetical protein